MAINFKKKSEIYAIFCGLSINIKCMFYAKKKTKNIQNNSINWSIAINWI
eukprot:UN00922